MLNNNEKKPFNSFEYRKFLEKQRKLLKMQEDRQHNKTNDQNQRPSSPDSMARKVSMKNVSSSNKFKTENNKLN